MSAVIRAAIAVTQFGIFSLQPDFFGGWLLSLIVAPSM